MNVWIQALLIICATVVIIFIAAAWLASKDKDNKNK